MDWFKINTISTPIQSEIDRNDLYTPIKRFKSSSCINKNNIMEDKTYKKWIYALDNVKNERKSTSPCDSPNIFLIPPSIKLMRNDSENHVYSNSINPDSSKEEIYRTNEVNNLISLLKVSLDQLYNINNKLTTTTPNSIIQ